MRHQSGDTLVEVLIATAILAAAVVGGLGMMNFGFGVILNSIERTQVQAGVNSQFSLIQYARDAYIRADRDGTVAGGPAVWQAIMDNATSAYSNEVCTTTGTPATNASRNPFYVKDDGSLYEPLPLTPGPAVPTAVPTAGTGLWVEAVRPTATTNYIDFYVKACWQPAAGSTNQESRSVMRLYTGASVVAAVGTPGPPPPAPACNSLDGFNFIRNGNFATLAGPGPGIDPAAEFSSDLPNRNDSVYPNDNGSNFLGALPGYRGGFSLQQGNNNYVTPPFPTTVSLVGRAFGGDAPRGVAASNTYFYSNPNARLDQGPMATGPFVGRLWYQNVSGLQVGAAYDFTAYFDNLLMQQSQGVNPKIRLRANGVHIFGPVEVFVQPDAYQRISLVFTATASSMTLEIFDDAYDIQGDDFAMTALALRRCV